MGFFSNWFGRKESLARKVSSYEDIGKAVSTPRNFEAFSKEAYIVNVIAYKAISLLARNAASIDWNLYTKNSRGEPSEIEEHPLLKLLDKPNPLQGGSAFFESLYAFYLLAGNSYVERVIAGKLPYELWSVRPDKMNIVPGVSGLPSMYVFKCAGQEVRFPVDQVTGNSDILHVKTFHPINQWYGLSPIEPSIYGVDQHNESSKWNLALLQNQAKPSGLLTVEMSDMNPTGTLQAPQKENIRQELANKYAGSQNAGRTMLLEGGLKWEQMGLSPKDMDWMEGKNASARDIALALGMPPLLLNIPGDSTYSNYKEARMAMYEDSILPMVDLVRDELNKWLVPMFGDNLFLDYDKDSIEALASKRADKFTQMQTSTFLTINEKREAVGYTPLDGGDVLLINSGQIPITDLQESPDGDATQTDTQDQPDANQSDQGDEDKPQGGNDNPDGEEDQVGNYVADQGKSLLHKKGLQVNALTSKGKERSWRQVNAIRNRLKSSFQMDLKEDFDDMARAIGKATQTNDARTAEFGALRAIGESSKKMQSTIEKHVLRTAKLFGTEVLESGKGTLPFDEVKATSRFNQEAQEFAKKRAAESITHIEGTSIKMARKKIRGILGEGLAEGATADEVAKQIQEEFDTVSTSRAQTIAKTEIGIASTQGSLEAAKALDIPDLKKVWISVQDDRTRDGESKYEADHLEMNEQAVGLNEKFSVDVNSDSPTQMDGPSDPSAPANQIINCRCTLAYERQGKMFSNHFTKILEEMDK